MNAPTTINPSAEYIVFESGRIAFESGELKPALDFCTSGPGRAIYGSMAVNKRGLTNSTNLDNEAVNPVLVSISESR